MEEIVEGTLKNLSSRTLAKLIKISLAGLEPLRQAIQPQQQQCMEHVESTKRTERRRVTDKEHNQPHVNQLTICEPLKTKPLPLS